MTTLRVAPCHAEFISASNYLPTTPNTPIANTISTYNYDNLDRITGNTTTSTTHGYSYDLTGNRTSLAIGGNSYPYTIATNSNRLMAEAGPTARSNTYDPAGNLTSNGQDTYSYYASGRLKQVTRNGTVIASYKYNGLGELVQKTNSSNVSTYYLYNNEHHLVGEYNQQGQTCYLTMNGLFVPIERVNKIGID